MFSLFLTYSWQERHWTDDSIWPLNTSSKIDFMVTLTLGQLDELLSLSFVSIASSSVFCPLVPLVDSVSSDPFPESAVSKDSVSDSEKNFLNVFPKSKKKCIYHCDSLGSLWEWEFPRRRNVVLWSQRPTCPWTDAEIPGNHVGGIRGKWDGRVEQHKGVGTASPLNTSNSNVQTTHPGTFDSYLTRDDFWSHLNSRIGKNK